VILNIKRFIIIGCVFLGYIFAAYVGEYYSLVDIGLKSFEAVTIFAPRSCWHRLEGREPAGAMAGIIAGSASGSYTLLIPALARAGSCRGASWKRSSARSS